jgi:AraC-like DNA-binding protein
MKLSMENRDETSNQKKIILRFVTSCLCVLGLSGWVLSISQDKDISVEELLSNLKAEHYSGKLIDLEVKEAGLETLFSKLEKASGLSFELSPDTPLQSLSKRTYSFHQVPWDKILALVLEEFNLEAVLKNGSVYIQPKGNHLVRIVREDQFQKPGSPLIYPLLYILMGLILTGGTAGFFIYKKRIKARAASSRGFSVDPEKAEEVMKKVVYLFDVEKAFRKEDISLQSLSRELSIPSYQLSWIINKKMNVTFSELVNSYRVEEVKKRLASPHDRDKSILDIAFDAGFNTKTSFNRVFKRLTRMTPSQYRHRYSSR